MVDLLVEISNLWQWFVGVIRDGRGGMVLLPAFLLLLAFEFSACRVTHRQWSNGDALTNLMVGGIGLIFNIAAGLLFAVVFIGVYDSFRLTTLPLNWWGFLVAFLLFEMVHYAHHMLSHRTGFFWAIHSIHHSSSDLNATVAPRALWGIQLFLPFTLIQPLLGVSLVHWGVIITLTSIYGIATHSSVFPRLGFLEHLIVTPANHRVHHARQLKYTDINYGQTLIIFDKIFGTHQLEDEEPIYCIEGDYYEKNPFKIQISGFKELVMKIKSAPDLIDKLRYLWKPPGWSHLGLHETTEARRARAAVDVERIQAA